jgi:hypothetical protein
MSFMAKIIFSSDCCNVRKRNYVQLNLIDSFSFIRIVGTYNSVNKVFHLVSMEVYYKDKSFVLIQDIHG